MNRTHYVSDFIIKQFDIKKFKKMIKAFLNLVDNFQMIIDSEEYQIRFTPNYELRFGGNRKPTTSKVESFVYSKYDTIEKKEQLLLKYKLAFNSLNEAERKMFIAVFINNLTINDLCEDFITYPDKLSKIRKSAIIKFSLKLGFDKFVDYF